MSSIFRCCPSPYLSFDPHWIRKCSLEPQFTCFQHYSFHAEDSLCTGEIWKGMRGAGLTGHDWKKHPQLLICLTSPTLPVWQAAGRDEHGLTLIEQGKRGREERRGEDLVTYNNSSLGEHCDPGHIPMQLESKDWTGGVGMVMEWYNEMLPSGHVVSPACRMEQALQSPQSPQLWVTGTATFLPEWIRMSGALGQGKNGTLDNWLHGCGQHFSATQGRSQARMFVKKKKKKKCRIGSLIVHYQRNKQSSVFKTELA